MVTATWLDRVLFDDCAVGKALIVAPKLVAAQVWPAQFRQWAHLSRLAGTVRLIGFDDLGLTPSTTPAGGRGPLTFRDRPATKRHLAGLPGRVHVCSWDAFPFVAKALGKDWPYQAVVFDESSFLRDQRSERGKAARHVVHRLGAVSHLAELTATPNANHDEAVWAQLDLVERGLLGETLTQFRETYCVPESRNWSTGQVYSWRVAPAMRAQFEAACARAAISVPDRLGIDLVEVPQWTPMSEASAAAYREIERDQVLAHPAVTAGSAAVLHGKLRQLASGHVYDDAGAPHALDPGKPERFRELVESIEGPVVAAYHWLFEQDWMRKQWGKHFAEVREAGAWDRFLAGKVKVLALHPASAGHGLDGAQRVCNQLVWTSVPEDLELYRQTNGRIRRPGQGKTCFIHLLIAPGTREQEVWDEVLPGKSTVADLLLRAARRGSEAVS